MVGLLIAVHTQSAQAAEIPPDAQAMLVLKLLAYDLALETRTRGTLQVVLLYRLGNQRSEAVCQDTARALRSAAASVVVKGRRVAVHEARFDELSLASDLEGAAAVFVCPSLADALPSISRLTRERDVLSVATSEEYVEAGIAVGLLALPTHAEILVNLAAAKEEGVEFDAKMLSVARVLR